MVGDQLAQGQRDQGVSGAALSTTVQPAASAGSQLGQRELVRIVVGDDGRRRRRRLPSPPSGGAACRATLCLAEVFGELIVAQQIGVEPTMPIGSSSWAPWVSARVAPTSAMVSSRSSSAWSSSAWCSWSRQRIRNSTSVDQVVVSKARRAAANGPSASATPASGAYPRTSPVAGLIGGKRLLGGDEPTVDQQSAVGLVAGLGATTGRLLADVGHRRVLH